MHTGNVAATLHVARLKSRRFRLRQFLFLILISVSTLGITGCGPLFYSASSHNVPLIEEKGETVLNMAGDQKGVAFHAAGGLSENISIKADVAVFLPYETLYDSYDNRNIFGTYSELGAGYFTDIDDVFVFEIFAFTGYGVSKNRFQDKEDDDDSVYGYLNVGHFDIGLQPDIGYKIENFEIAVSARLFYLRFVKVDGDLVFRDESQRDYLKENRSHFILEPALTCRVGHEKIKYQLQLVLLDNSVPKYSDVFPVLGTIGLNLSF